MEHINENTHRGVICLEKNTTKSKISASPCISIKNRMNYDQNKKIGLFKFQSGYRKLYLNSPYSRKIINAQTGVHIHHNRLTLCSQG